MSTREVDKQFWESVLNRAAQLTGVSGEIDSRTMIRTAAPEQTAGMSIETRDDLVVGIDFGTSYSSAALLKADGMHVIPLSDDGETMMPSLVCLAREDETLVGFDAQKASIANPQATIFGAKRLLGRSFSDHNVERIISGLAIRSFAGFDRFVRFESFGEIYSAEDICGMIFRNLRRRVSDYVGVDVREAVITAPVAFTSIQRTALSRAAQLGGFRVRGMLSEPTAALLSQQYDQAWEGRAAVFDFGGGTFDFCTLNVESHAFKVICAGGEPWLGGDDFDHVLATEMAASFERQTDVDVSKRAVEWQRVLRAAEQAKRRLSSHLTAKVRVEDLIATRKGKRGLKATVSRASFEDLADHLITRAIDASARVLAQGKIAAKDVDSVILTGGTSLIPAVQREVAAYFGCDAKVAEPHLAVVQGAAVRGALLAKLPEAGDKMRYRQVLDVLGRSIGAALPGEPVIPVFERNTPVPATKTLNFRPADAASDTLAVCLYDQATSRVDESRPFARIEFRRVVELEGPQDIDITFKVDQGGLLNIEAIIAGTRYSQTVMIRTE